MRLSILTRTCFECNALPGWCKHLEQYISSGADAAELDFEMLFELPMYPTLDIWPAIHIGSPDQSETYAPLTLKIPSLILNETRDFDLGFWIKGEGCQSIRRVLHDWIKTRCGLNSDLRGLKCKSSSHTLKHTRFNHAAASTNEANFVALDNWYYAAYGICYAEYKDLTEAGISSFGLVPKI